MLKEHSCVRTQCQLQAQLATDVRSVRPMYDKCWDEECYVEECKSNQECQQCKKCVLTIMSKLCATSVSVKFKVLDMRTLLSEFTKFVWASQLCRENTSNGCSEIKCLQGFA